MFKESHKRKAISALIPQIEQEFDPCDVLACPFHPSSPHSLTSSGESTILMAEESVFNAKPKAATPESLQESPQKRQKCSDFGLPFDLDEIWASTLPTGNDMPIEDQDQCRTDSFGRDCRGEKPVFAVSPSENTTKAPVRAAAKRVRKENTQLGRRNLQDCPLKEFYQRGKPIKHEFYVIRSTRKFVHCLKKALKSSTPKPKGLLYVLTHSKPANQNLHAFISYVIAKKECFIGLIDPNDMPNSDCKEVRTRDSAFASWSKGFIQWFMGRSPYLIIAFHLFCEVVFEGTPEDLCQAWGMKCCEGLCGPNCPEKWSKLKAYTQHDSLIELGLSPLD